MRVLAYAYRQWAKSVFHAVNLMHYVDIQIECDEFRVNEDVINAFKPDLILFYGWSWRVPDWVIDNYIALCLHPSPLPKYRGGSPIQNQIINGEKESAVSIFRMAHDVDAGPLCAQVSFPLIGNMREILARIRHIGIEETNRIIKEYMSGGIRFWPQKGDATSYQRRKPEESEITKGELATASAEYLYNKIRALQDPYPNAFIECHSGTKLYITEAHLD